MLRPAERRAVCSIRSCCRLSHRTGRGQPIASDGTAMPLCCRMTVSATSATRCYCKRQLPTSTHSARAGTLASWQENVARYAVDNSRLVLALSAAFAGPLVGPCSAEGGGIHFRGASSTGKSTALHVAGSVWGGGDATGYVRSWRATANGLEGVALSHCDTLLCLDEMSQPPHGMPARSRICSPTAPVSPAVRVMARPDVPRCGASCSCRPGEISLASKSCQRAMVGPEAGSRITSLHGRSTVGRCRRRHWACSKNLHGFKSADAFARHLRAATAQHYGVASREYVAAIVSDIEEVRQSATTLMQMFCETYVPAGADGQIDRVAQRFALVACGGEIAAQCGIVPWKRGDALAAAGQCLDAWLNSRGGIDAAEVQDGIEQVRAFLLAHGMARFMPAWDDDADGRTPIRDLAGFRQKTGDGWDFYITTDAWRKILAGLDPRHDGRGATSARHDRRGRYAPLEESAYPKPQSASSLYHVLSTALEDANEA